MKRLLKIVEKSKAKIVISSAWRKTEGLLACLLECLKGAKIPSESVIGVTPPELENSLEPDPNARCMAIKTWLRKHPDVKTWVALDDYDLPNAGLPVTNTVTTDPAIGLEDAHVPQAVRNLLKPLGEPIPDC